MQRRNNNVKKQKKAASRVGETVRIASLLQKGIRSGRSSYVEMRALARLTKQNVKTRVQTILPLLKLNQDGNLSDSIKDTETVTELLQTIPSQAAEGYTDILTPNGNFRQEDLDKLLSVDADIVTSLAVIETQLKSHSRSVGDTVRNLKDILIERKEFVDGLKA